MVGKPCGIFDLEKSDNFCGSFIKKKDVEKIFGNSNFDFKTLNEEEVVDEKILQKKWYESNSKISLDEIILKNIIELTYPNAIINQQIRIGRFLMDLYVQIEEKKFFIEFDGPSHFMITKYGEPKNIFIKKEKIEDITGIQVINWPFWIQKCSSNIKAIVEKSEGFGALWNCDIFFSQFIFDADFIVKLNEQFNCYKNGYGYFYEEWKGERNKPEHFILEKIRNGEKNENILLPIGYRNKEMWLPKIYL